MVSPWPYMAQSAPAMEHEVGRGMRDTRITL